MNDLTFNPLTDEMPTRWAFFHLLALAAKVLIVETPFKAFWKGLGKTYHPIEKKVCLYLKFWRYTSLFVLPRVRLDAHVRLHSILALIPKLHII